MNPFAPVHASAARARRPFRWWMSGSVAVVTAALCGGRVVAEGGAVDETVAVTLRVVHHSPYGVDETLRRIEALARERGQGVLLRVGGAEPVIVFASSIGGTPVLMDAADSAPDVPLAVQVRQAPEGGAEVLIAAGEAWRELPETVAEELAALPGLVERALS